MPRMGSTGAGRYNSIRLLCIINRTSNIDTIVMKTPFGFDHVFAHKFSFESSLGFSVVFLYRRRSAHSFRIACAVFCFFLAMRFVSEWRKECGNYVRILIIFACYLKHIICSRSTDMANERRMHVYEGVSQIKWTFSAALSSSSFSLLFALLSFVSLCTASDILQYYYCSEVCF